MSNAAELAVVEDTEMDQKKLITSKVVYTLGIYPRLSPSMLQVGLGTSLPPALWRPVIDELVDQGILIREHVSAETPSGRLQTHVTLSLNPKHSQMNQTS